MVAATRPTVQDVRERLKVPVDAYTDGQLQDTLDAETDSQDRDCRTEPYVAALRSALFRRVARSLAAEGVPLGILADEYGTAYLRSNDAEIHRLEGPLSKLNLGSGRAAAT